MTDDDMFRMTDDLDVVVRRSPRYSVFLLTGVVLGFLVAGILVLLPVDTSVLTSDYSIGATMGLLMIVLGLLGLAAGGAVALILDRVNARKARTYTVRAEFVARSRPRDGAAAPVHGRNGDSPATTGLDTDGVPASEVSAGPETDANPDVDAGVDEDANLDASVDPDVGVDRDDDVKQ